MASGIGVNDQCVKEYQSLKLKKTSKFIVFKISDDNREIIVHKTSSSPSYEEFLAELPENEPRWAVYDFEYEKGDGKRNKLVFYAWSPDGAKVKAKMLFASSKEALRRSLVGIATEIQGTDYDEVSYENVLDKASKGS